MIDPAAINRLLDAATIEELWDIHTRTMAGYGFDRLLYGCTQYRTAHSLGSPDDFIVLTNHAPDYAEPFVNEGLYFHAPMSLSLMTIAINLYILMAMPGLRYRIRMIVRMG